MQNLPGLIYCKATSPFCAGWNWIRGDETLLLKSDPAILRSLQQPHALLSIFAFGTTLKELDTVQGSDSDSIPIAVDPCASASIFKEDAFFTSWEPMKGM
jgi:hypothetical protein